MEGQNQMPIPLSLSNTSKVKKSLNPFDDNLENDSPEVYCPGNLGDGSVLAVQQLERSWKEVDAILQSHTMDPFAMEELREHLSSIERLLVKDTPESNGQIGPCLQYVLSENIIENVYMFSTRQKVYAKDVRIMLLCFFAEVLTRSSQPVLIHQQVLRPISKLLRACEGTNDREIEISMVPLLHAMCILMQENQSLLDLFFIESQVHMQSRFLVFTQLLTHMHSSGEVGNRARDAILLCLSLADQLPDSNLTHFIASDCNFCQVLATGLSALYSDLPCTRDLVVDEWQSPLPVIVAAVPEVRTFVQALDFCNSVLQMAPKLVCDTMLTLVRDGFLQQVMGAALLQSSDSAVMFATAYVTIFLKHISNVALMRAFLRHLLQGSYDDRRIIYSLMQNISKPNHLLCAVTLELFIVLVNLNCEDLLLELVLKYLLPGHHIMPNQLAIVGSADVYSQAARKLLQLLPASCIAAENMFLASIKKSQPQISPRATEGASGSPSPLPDFTSTTLFNSNFLVRPTPTTNSTTSLQAPLTNLPVLPTPTPTLQQPDSTNPFDHPLPNHQPKSRSRSDSDASSSSLVSMSSISSSITNAGITSTFGNGTQGQANLNPPISTGSSAVTASDIAFQFECVTAGMAYFSYLTVSREAIRDRVIKCRCWSSVYDKCEVSKEMLEIQEQNRKMTKSLEMEDLTSVQVRVTTEEESSSVDIDNNEEDSKRFRSRASTLSSARVLRTASLRAHNKLHSRRAMVTKSQVMEGEEGEMKLVTGILACENVRLSTEDVPDPSSDLLSSELERHGPRRSGTISGGRPRRSLNSSRMSPNRIGKFSSLCKFDDNIGLFLKVVMDKLMDMMGHPPVINILMTQLLSCLAHYPQPLLRSLLLNHQLVLKPGIPNLLFVVQFLKQTVDRYARTEDGFEKRLGRARKTMVYRAQVRNQCAHDSMAKLLSKHLRRSSQPDVDISFTTPEPPVFISSPPSTSSVHSKSKRNSKAGLSSNKKEEGRDGRGKGGLGEGGVQRKSRKKSKKVSTDTLYAVVIFYEFVRELASISEEHSVLHSLLYLPNPTSLLLVQ